MANNWTGATDTTYSTATNWSLGHKPVAGDDVVFNNAVNCVMDETTALLQSLDMTGYTGSLSGNTSILIKGLTGSTQVCKLKGLGTWTGDLSFRPVSTTAVINFTSNGELLTTMTITTSLATSLVVLQDNLAFTAVKTDSITLSTQALDLNGFTITGNSATNRLLITSNTLGTARVVTGALATSFNNVDFRDITFTSAGALDLTNGATKLIGDCGGNTASGGALTLTTSRVCNFITAGGDNWADVANWDTATDTDRVPLPQDDVTFATAFDSGVTITANMPRLGRSIDFSGATATGAGVLPTLDLGNAVTNYGSLNLTGLKAGGFTGNFGWNFESQARSGTNYLTSNGQSFPGALTIKVFGSNLQLADVLVVGTMGGKSLTVNNGTFTDAGFSISMFNFLSSFSGNPIKSIIKTGNWTLNRTSVGTIWDFSTFSTNSTFTDTAGTITFSNNTSTTQTFHGGGQSFNNLSIVGGGTGAIIFTGANSFNGLPQIVGGTKTLTFPSTVTTTFRGSGVMNFGNGVNLVTLNSSSAGTASTLAISGGGVVNASYLDITDINGSPANTWYHDNHSTLNSGTGWGSYARKGGIDTYSTLVLHGDGTDGSTLIVDSSLYSKLLQL